MAGVHGRSMWRRQAPVRVVLAVEVAERKYESKRKGAVGSGGQWSLSAAGQ